MTCESRVYSGITTEVFHNLRATVEDYGIFLPDGNNGNVSGQGISGRYVWDESGQTLSIDIKSKPWFLPYESIYKMLGDVIQSTRKN